MRHANCILFTVVFAVACLHVGTTIVRAAEKAPIPDAAARQAALAIVREIYQAEFSGAKTAEDKSALAKSIIRAGKASEKDLDRFVLLRVGRDVAAAGGDADLAREAIQQIDLHFQVDALAMRSAALSRVAKAVDSRDTQKKLAIALLKLIDDCLAADRFELATNTMETAHTAARRTRDVRLLKRARSKADEMSRLAKRFETVQESLTRLKESPDDAGANLVVGKYRCFVKADWDGGLPMLARGDDIPLSRLATWETEQPAEPAERAKIGDDWWELAAAVRGIEQSAMYARAAFRYRQAAPSMKGLTGVKIKKRLAQLAETHPDALRAARRMAGEKVEVVAADDTKSTTKRSRSKAKPVRGTITIPANSEKGFVIGSVKQGTTLAFQYVSGKWKGWGGRGDICPDKTDGRGGLICRLAIVAFDAEGTMSQTLTLVPEGTKDKPFTYEVPQDVALLVLRINDKDNKWGGNPGKVQYNLTLTPP